MIILAIETSCDETAIAILEAKRDVKHSVFNIISNVVASQVRIHAPWGGVVPNLAKREHQRNLLPILKRALSESRLLKVKNSNLAVAPRYPESSRNNENSKLKVLEEILVREENLLAKLLFFLKKYQPPKIDLIAVTQGPGLEPALWVGINLAKALAYFWNKPIIGINHLEGHITSVLLKQNRGISKSQISNSKQKSKIQIPKIKFPIIALVVSGGHTELVLIKKWLNYKVIGRTLDDAAGEAFDKVAKMLELGYPGGPVIAAEAAKDARSRASRIPIRLPRPMINSKDYNFSFSGLKTAVLYLLRDLQNRKLRVINHVLRDICAEFQQAVIDVLIKKTMRAANAHKARTIILGGGVAANQELRKQLQRTIAETNFENKNTKLLMPEMEFTGDNAAMIGLSAFFRASKSRKNSGKNIIANSNLKL